MLQNASLFSEVDGEGGGGWEGNLLTLYLSRRRKSMTSIVFNPVLDLKSYLI